MNTKQLTARLKETAVFAWYEAIIVGDADFMRDTLLPLIIHNGGQFIVALDYPRYVDDDMHLTMSGPEKDLIKAKKILMKADKHKQIESFEIRPEAKPTLH